MPVNLSIKNVPDELAARLRLRAQRNRRSLQRELLAILDQAADDGAGLVPSRPPPQDRRRLSIDDIVERAHARFPQTSESSVELIRHLREGRYGPGWLDTRQHDE